jgi:hypothetical protein
MMLLQRRCFSSSSAHNSGDSDSSASSGGAGGADALQVSVLTLTYSAAQQCHGTCHVFGMSLLSIRNLLLTSYYSSTLIPCKLSFLVEGFSLLHSCTRNATFT